MKFKIIPVLLSLLLLTPAYAAKQPGWDYFVESAQIDLTPTGTKWKVGYDQEVKGQYITELVPAGQSVKSWKEIVTIVYASYKLLSKDNSMEHFMTANLAEVEQVCKSNKGTVTTKVFDQNTTSILYRFEMKGCGKGMAADQISIVKHIKGEYGIHTVKFSSKAPLNTPEREAQMREVISKAYVMVKNEEEED